MSGAALNAGGCEKNCRDVHPEGAKQRKNPFASCAHRESRLYIRMTPGAIHAEHAPARRFLYNSRTLYRDRLLGLYERYAESIRAGREAALATGETEAFHRLRVGMKRTRALLNLVASITVDFDGLKAYRRVRKLFRVAGAVRDLQVQLEIATELEDSLKINLAAYKMMLRDREADAQEAFTDQAPAFPIERLSVIRTAIDEAMQGADELAARALALSCLRVLLREFTAWDIDSPTADLHELRTLTKQSFYSWELIDEAFPGSLEYPRQKERLHEIQRLLGKWHDYEVAMLFSGGAQSRGLQGDEKADDYRQFYEALRKEKGKLVSRVRRRFRRARKELANIPLMIGSPSPPKLQNHRLTSRLQRDPG